VSSSEIRARVNAGRPIDALVPAAVAGAICEAGCYAKSETRNPNADPPPR
jgi:nicotinic acid mononucleotide adenylyltransferase